MNDGPTVSIITPAYNAAAFLSETMASVVAQTWPDFEALIVDDNSSDDTLSIARRWERSDPRIRVFTRPHGGPRRLAIPRLRRPAAGISRCWTATTSGIRPFSKLNSAYSGTGRRRLMW